MALLTSPPLLAHAGVTTLSVVAVLAVVAGVSAFGRDERPSRGSALLLAVTYAAIGFQVIHFAEHLLQSGYWVLHPSAAPWLTPWAAVGRDWLASTTDGQPGTGNEVLHLAGNLAFFAGLAAASALWRRTAAGTAPRLRTAVWIQGAHVAEHVLLTLTWLYAGQAWGLSSLFGLLEAGTPVASTVRVWLHFAFNLAATVYAVGGLLQLHRRGPAVLAAPG